ncbi:organomercurial lyase [Aneurinibacillus sp. Ricciae_BoGa-3]|uniref:organomercurial lyase n=1 Tax=Aneurinibacillus sp. Ricciae_BoGa-3 TaxID=3022697 RepID=UPI002341AF60|nr:organomercurial lyase [Aneurinibacillus sp. Ricciae_BoGa-3]WCK52987.1 organomercurial lyase [Aneurinibacillus sp. Ricciae_BoGa-3]
MNHDQTNASLQGLTEKVLQTIGLPKGGFKEKISSLTPTENMIRTGIILTMVEGKSVNIKDLTSIWEGKGIDIKSTLPYLSQLDLIHWDQSSGRVTVAYPFSGTATSHRVTLAGKSPTYAMCAIDALGIPSMFEADTEIDSKCAYCGEKIIINVMNNVPVSKPDAVVVGVGTISDNITCCDTCETQPSASLSTSCCPAIQFFCSEDHWIQFKNSNSTSARDRLTLPESFIVASHVFGESIQGFKNELNVQMEADKIILISERFTCKGCMVRVNDAIIDVPGLIGKPEKKGNLLISHLIPEADRTELVKAAQNALESDPYYPFPVTVKYH